MPERSTRAECRGYVDALVRKVRDHGQGRVTIETDIGAGRGRG